ncbi:MAG: nucleotidyl transferase AbiEii/AbiGii toxin family protein [Thermoplasmata archaeon]|nr:MAG: nucleotidyl transferase AbiEii/AbiGii toxin family protein [Thermoplasmata archaeon]
MDLSLYQDTISEKIERICDILIQTNKISTLRDHLSFYGGTALNFLYLNVPRLSEDLDFNYRQVNSQDWGEVRNDIDIETKRILYDLGYHRESIKIQPMYNLCRFYIEYINSKNLKDLIKIETGYMRRIPILKNDTFKEFIHPVTGQHIDIKTPQKEELFANKFCTMFSRESMSVRDIFDVYNISKAEFEFSLFCDVVMIESIFMNIDIMNFSLTSLDEKMQMDRIQDFVAGEIDWTAINEGVKSFVMRIQAELKVRDHPKLIREFHKSKTINIDQIINKSKLNDGIQEHPILLWIIEEISK